MAPAILALIALAPPPNPLARAEGLRLTRVQPIGGDARVGKVQELQTDATGTWRDPLDPADARLEATLAAPDGRTVTIPGYFDPAQGWRLRWMPTLPGTYRASVRLVTRQGRAEAPGLEVVVAAGDAPAYVTASPRDTRVLDRAGRAWWPIGVSVPLEDAAKVDVGNAVRTGLRTVDAGAAFVAEVGQMEQTLSQFEAQGRVLWLSLQDHRPWSNRPGGTWRQNPLADLNGGPLRIWSDVWISPAAARITEQRLRYLVARVGAFPSLGGWELFDSVDLADDLDPLAVRGWHERTARLLRSLDPSRRPITTLMFDSRGIKDIEQIPELDVTQTTIASADPAMQVMVQQSRKASWLKPHLFASVRATLPGGRAPADPEAVGPGQAMWAAAGVSAAGAAFPELASIADLTPALRRSMQAVAGFTEGIDWPAEGFRQVRPAVSYQSPPKPLPLRDISIAPGPVDFRPTPLNEPRTLRLRNEKVEGLPVSGILHGKGQRRELHNPLRFVVNTPRPTRLMLEITGVSGAGAGLRVWVDGKRVLTRDFAPTAGQDETARYNGTVPIPLTTGVSDVVIENVGSDWVRVNYRFERAAVAKSPAVEVFASSGQNTVLAWVRPTGNTWQERVVAGRPSPRVLPSRLTFKGQSAGTWRIRYFDPPSGRVLGERTATAGLDGTLVMPVPALAGDLGIRADRTRPAS